MTEGERNVQINGDRLKELRVQRGWSQIGLAKEVGVEQPTINRLETGARKMARLSTVKKIADVLGTTTDELLVHRPREVNRSAEEERQIRDAMERYTLSEPLAEQALQQIRRLQERERKKRKTTNE